MVSSHISYFSYLIRRMVLFPSSDFCSWCRCISASLRTNIQMFTSFIGHVMLPNDVNDIMEFDRLKHATIDMYVHKTSRRNT